MFNEILRRTNIDYKMLQGATKNLIKANTQSKGRFSLGSRYNFCGYLNQLEKLCYST